jgi:hypothetical protein
MQAQRLITIDPSISVLGLAVSLHNGSGNAIRGKSSLPEVFGSGKTALCTVVYRKVLVWLYRATSIQAPLWESFLLILISFTTQSHDSDDILI